jgi:signal transduction histidine kinase
MTNIISSKISHRKNATCLRHSVVFCVFVQRIKIPVRPCHPGGRCYKIIRAYGSAISFSMEDNGNGIPQNILDKIFQPFFTTKPTGQGTGLGLSLTYDILKANGGEIRVETKMGEEAEFIINLPFRYQ